MAHRAFTAQRRRAAGAVEKEYERSRPACRRYATIDLGGVPTARWFYKEPIVFYRSGGPATLRCEGPNGPKQMQSNSEHTLLK